MYYSTDNQHIVLKGFAIAGEYAPLYLPTESGESTAALPFIGVKYRNDGATWGASEFVLGNPDMNGMPTTITISKDTLIKAQRNKFRHVK